MIEIINQICQEHLKWNYKDDKFQKGSLIVM